MSSLSPLEKLKTPAIKCGLAKLARNALTKRRDPTVICPCGTSEIFFLRGENLTYVGVLVILA